MMNEDYGQMFSQLPPLMQHQDADSSDWPSLPMAYIVLFSPLISHVWECEHWTPVPDSQPGADTVMGEISFTLTRNWSSMTMNFGVNVSSLWYMCSTPPWSNSVMPDSPSLE